MRLSSRIARGAPILFLLGVVAAIILACSGATTTNVGSNNGGSGSSTPAAPAKVGSTITVDNVAVTLISVKAISGDEFIKPKTGNQFVVVTVKIVNKSGSDFEYNPFDFNVKSGTGNLTHPEVAPSTYKGNNELEDGSLAPGGNVTGDIIFQAPKGDHKAALTWQPSIFDSKSDNAWNLGL